MKIIRTFAVLNDSLFSVQFENEISHEFSRIFNIWNDPEYLFDFFQNNISDLQSGFWGDFTIPEAIEKIRWEAGILEQKILELAEKGQTNRFENLSTLFKPLFNDPCRIDPYEKSKAKNKKGSWIRVYAIRIDLNIFVVCGGAIKLTRTMNNRDHLLLELEKMQFTSRYLSDENQDTLDFVELL